MKLIFVCDGNWIFVVGGMVLIDLFLCIILDEYGLDLLNVVVDQMIYIVIWIDCDFQCLLVLICIGVCYFKLSKVI